MGGHKNFSPSQDPVPAGRRWEEGCRGAAFLSRWNSSNVCSLLLCPHRLGISGCPFQALARFPKSRGEPGGGGAGWVSPQTLRTALTFHLNHPNRTCASRRAAPPRTESARGPATSRARRSASVPGRRSQAGAASVGPSPRPGARSAEAAPNLPPDSPAADGAYLLTWPRRCPGVPRGKAVLRGGGGGGAPIP